MMESFGLYEDLSLFSGDLLVGVNPLASELPSLEPDGGFQDFSKFQQHVDLFQDELPKPSNPVPQAVQDDCEWMDKKMDLINLLSGPNVQITIQEVTPSSDNVEESPSEPVDASSLPGHSEAQFEVLQPVRLEDTISRETLLQNVTDFLSSDLSDPTPTTVADISFSGLGDDIGDFSSDGLASLLSEEEMNALSAPILSPVSPQDVESILSSGPSSPESMASINDAVVPQIKTVDESFFFEDHSVSAPKEDLSSKASTVGPVRTVRSSRMKKYQPYKDFDSDFEEKSPARSSRGSKATDRKERKKQQNKDAALRYRQKKKEELTGVFSECDELEKTNQDLKDKVEGMTREIQYLKDLLLEVYKAKGIQPKGILALA